MSEQKYLIIESLSHEDRLVWLVTYSAGGAAGEEAGREAWTAVRLRERAERCGAPRRSKRKAPDPE